MRKTAILDLIIIIISWRLIIVSGRRYLLAVAKITSLFIDFVELDRDSAHNRLLVYKIVFDTLMLMIGVCEVGHILLLIYVEILVMCFSGLLLVLYCSHRSLILGTFEYSSRVNDMLVSVAELIICNLVWILLINALLYIKPRFRSTCKTSAQILGILSLIRESWLLISMVRIIRYGLSLGGVLTAHELT